MSDLQNCRAKLQKIKVLAFDIDGTLTDGSIYIGLKGEALKVFHVRDGYGIKAAEKAGFKVLFITGRPLTEPIIQRIYDLNMSLECLKGSVKDKVSCAEKILQKNGLGLENLAFMGDDLPDLPLLKVCGFSAAPSDAVQEVLDSVNFVSTKKGGGGAAREFIDLILKQCSF